MSELKADKTFVFGEECEAYKKSEADKVIAELKRQIEFLKVTTDSCKNCAQCAYGMVKVFEKEFNPLKDKLRSQKYKRCLAMARWSAAECVVNQDTYKMYLTHKSEFRIGHFRKWYLRWLAIAKKFKPKTAQ